MSEKLSAEYSEKLAIAMGAVLQYEYSKEAGKGWYGEKRYELPDEEGFVEIYYYDWQETEIIWKHPTFCEVCGEGLREEDWPDFRDLEWYDYIKKLVRKLWCLREPGNSIGITMYDEKIRIKLAVLGRIDFESDLENCEEKVWEGCLFWLRENEKGLAHE